MFRVLLLKEWDLANASLQLASAPLHTDECLPDLHLPLFRLHLLLESAMRVLLVPPPYPLCVLVPLVGSLLLRFQ